MNTYRIYYPNGKTVDGWKEKPPVHGAIIVLQQYPDGLWATAHGADFFVWEWDRWNGVSLDGLLQWLKRRDLIRPTIGIYHDVLWKDEWTQVDQIGFYEWVEDEQLALFGQMVPDEEFDELMKRVLDDKVYVAEHGELPK